MPSGSAGEAHGAETREQDGAAATRELGAAGEDEHARVRELADVVAEEADNLVHAAAEVRDLLAGPASDRSALHIPGARGLLSSIRRGDWQPGDTQHGAGQHGTGQHGAGPHLVEPHVPAVVEGFGIVMPLLAAVINELAEGDRRRIRDQQRKSWIAGLDRAHTLSTAPTTVDPAVSFAPGSCCLIEVGPDAVTILPGGRRRTFRREHREDVFGSAFAQRWAQLLSLRPDVQVSDCQAAELAAWTDLPGGKSLKRAPAVAIVFASRRPGRARPSSPAR